MGKTPLKIYVASSWKNQDQPSVVKCLRANGYEVYDFRDPHAEFNWATVWEQFDKEWQNDIFEDYIKALDDPIAGRGFDWDYNAMISSDVCVMIMPCGKSAHLEAGYFVGAKKPLLIYIPNDFQVELMYKMATHITNNFDSILKYLSILNLCSMKQLVDTR